MTASGAQRPRVVILGAGFGGLQAALGLRRADADVTVVDRRNFHLFQPLLYQVATGGLSPGDIASPVRWVLRRQKHTRVLLGEAEDVDVPGRTVRLADGEVLPYDALLVATGASHDYFGHGDWARHAPGLKTVEDALEMRRRIFFAFEAAEREADEARRDAWLTFAVVGAGPTGVELAGALAELARDTLPSDFRAIDPSRARILLMEGGDRVLPAYPPDLSERALRSLEELGVEVQLHAMVRGVDAGGVEVERDGTRERVAARTVLWAAGVQASPLGRRLAEAAGVEPDRSGRVPVASDCTLPGHPEVMVIGDLARLEQDGALLPGVAPVAIQQGRYAARRLERFLGGRETPPFRYRDRGNLATIGRSRAVADLGRLHFAGLPAWLLWLGVHIFFLIDFENRVLVMVQWAWNYITRNRGTRLIAGRGGPAPADG